MKKILSIALCLTFNTLAFADTEILAYQDGRRDTEEVKSFVAEEGEQISNYVSICKVNIDEDNSIKTDIRISGTTNGGREIANKIRYSTGNSAKSFEACCHLNLLLNSSSKENPVKITLDEERNIVKVDKE